MSIDDWIVVANLSILFLTVGVAVYRIKRGDYDE
jgi:hypothetical protein